jgi:hypothetical protein
MEISWTDRVKTDEVLPLVKEERDVIRVVKRSLANWIGHILHMNCLLKHVTERQIEVMDDLKETRRYSKLNEEALNNMVWRT